VALVPGCPHNRSNIPLSDDATMALTKGLAFTPTPQEPPTKNLIIAAEQAAMLMGGDTEAATHIRSHTINAINNFRTPHPNMTRTKREAIHQLRKNPEVTIIPADKGRMTVLMPTADYETNGHN
jgi:hypothetical protein